MYLKPLRRCTGPKDQMQMLEFEAINLGAKDTEDMGKRRGKEYTGMTSISFSRAN